MQSQYLAHGNLHFKPFSARLGEACLFARTELQQRADRTQWHGRAMVDLSRATTIIGAAILIPIAFIEMAAAFVLASLGTILNKFLCLNKSPFLQKYTLMSYSYGFHSLTTAVLAVLTLLKPPTYHYHTLNLVGDRMVHYGSAAFTQVFIGSCYDCMAGRNREAGGENYGAERAANLVGDNLQDLVNDTIRAVGRDFGSDLRNVEIPAIQDFLRRHEEYRDLLNNPLSTIQDPAQRTRWIRFIQTFLQEAGLLVGANGVFELAGRNPEETAYQNHLKRTVRQSFLSIHNTPALAKALSQNGTAAQGQEHLTSFDASIYVPLANYSQYIELLEEETHCPDEFQTNDLRVYNERRQTIVNLKAQLKATDEATGLPVFSPDMRSALVKKLLNPDRFNLEAAGFSEAEQTKIMDLYRGITVISGSLHQGKLLCRLVIDLNAPEDQMISSANFFQKACQEAAAEIDGR